MVRLADAPRRQAFGENHGRTAATHEADERQERQGRPPTRTTRKKEHVPSAVKVVRRTNKRVRRFTKSAPRLPISSAANCRSFRTALGPTVGYDRVSMSLRLTLLLVVVSLAGCAESAASHEVRTAAAVDLDCDPSEIKLDEARPRQTIATGCGRKQIYRYRCTTPKEGDRDRKECAWVPMADPGN